MWPLFCNQTFYVCAWVRFGISPIQLSNDLLFLVVWSFILKNDIFIKTSHLHKASSFLTVYQTENTLHVSSDTDVHLLYHHVNAQR